MYTYIVTITLQNDPSSIGFKINVKHVVECIKSLLAEFQCFPFKWGLKVKSTNL